METLHKDQFTHPPCSRSPAARNWSEPCFWARGSWQLQSHKSHPKNTAVDLQGELASRGWFEAWFGAQVSETKRNNLLYPYFPLLPPVAASTSPSGCQIQTGVLSAMSCLQWKCRMATVANAGVLHRRSGLRVRQLSLHTSHAKRHLNQAILAFSKDSGVSFEGYPFSGLVQSETNGYQTLSC